MYVYARARAERGKSPLCVFSFLHYCAEQNEGYIGAEMPTIIYDDKPSNHVNKD